LILGLGSPSSRLSAALRPRCAGLAALTSGSVEPPEGHYVMPGGFCPAAKANESVSSRSNSMSDTSITPNIEVTIGRQTRLYHAFVTTAPAALDAPSTLTLYAGPIKDVAGFAVDSVALDAIKAATPSRLVLIDTAELGWQRARCRSRAHRLTPADPVLVGLNTLQQWLWQRLQIPIEEARASTPTTSATRHRANAQELQS
jgi:hypothetical protein